MIRPSRWVGILLVLLATAPTLAAQSDSQGDAGRQHIQVQGAFGFEGIMPAERWAPVRFTLTSTARNIVGTATLSFQQDGSQSLAVSVPVMLTAGMPAPIDFFVCLPRIGIRGSFTLRDESGRVLLRERIDSTSFGMSSSTMLDPPIMVRDRVTVLAIGVDRLGHDQTAWSQYWHSKNSLNSRSPSPVQTKFALQSALQDEGPSTFEERFTVASIAPEQAFASWAAYDGVAAIVAPASVVTALPARVRREILLWVQRGGRLIIYLDDGSHAWRQWLPADDNWDFFWVDEPRVTVVPQSLGTATQAHAEAAGFESDTPLDVAATIPARPIRLTERARALGYRPLWNQVTESDSMLAVQGPFGFGTLVLIGFDPASLSVPSSRSACLAAWAGVLEACMPVASTAPYSDAIYYDASSSGATIFQIGAIRSIVDSCVENKGIRLSTLMLITALLCVFALTVGPIDAIWLKRLGWRHWSWLTAIGWITLFSIVMLILPRFERDNQNEINRVIVTDALLDEAGAAVVSWKTGVTVSYAGRNAGIGPDDRRAGAWWRGISPIEMYVLRRSIDAVAPVRAIQSVVPGPDGARSSCLPLVPSQRVWTARALLDSAPDPPPIAARVERTADGYRLLLGRAPLEIVGGVRVRIGSSLWEPKAVAPGSVTPLPADGAVGVRSLNPRPTGTESTLTSSLFEDQSHTRLPNIDDHDQAIAAMLASERFALVTLDFRSDQSDIPLVGADRTHVFGAVRLVVPIVDRSMQETAP